MLIWLKKSTAASKSRVSTRGRLDGAGRTVDCEPLVQVLAIGEEDGISQVARSESASHVQSVVVSQHA